VLVQNRVSSALSQLPQSVQNQGVTVQKKSTAILLFVDADVAEATYDSLFLSNYATINIRDELVAPCPASATSRCLAPASIRCGSGSIRTSCMAAG
jgi:hypothetical protein